RRASAGGGAGGRRRRVRVRRRCCAANRRQPRRRGRRRDRAVPGRPATRRSPRAVVGGAKTPTSVQVRGASARVRSVGGGVASRPRRRTGTRRAAPRGGRGRRSSGCAPPVRGTGTCPRPGAWGRTGYGGQ